MQPYFFPYIGYFQLINSVDKFIVYDDVTFIKQGWINRNNILVNNQKHLFSIPLKKLSSNQLIFETEIDDTKDWSKTFLKTIEYSYKNAPFFKEIFLLLKNCFNFNTTSITGLAIKSIREVCDYLEIQTEISETSRNYNNQNLKNQERIIDICLKENSNKYINLIGGKDLYNQIDFAQKSITLNFIKSDLIEYSQFKNEFISNLSMIDVLMFNSKKEIKEMLIKYELV